METPKRILEKRRSVRIAESFIFKIGHQAFDFQAISINLSTHGVLGVVDRDIPMMSQVKLALQLPLPPHGKSAVRTKTIQMKGVVVRKDKDVRTGRYLIAIYFSTIKPADQKRLENFISRYLKTS